jgi:hypothetical protein
MRMSRYEAHMMLLAIAALIIAALDYIDKRK